MDSGLYVQVFSSVEVIVAALVLILLLPLVFFIASTRSRKRFVRVPSPSRKTPPVRRPKKKPAAATGQEDPDAPPLPGPRARSGGRAADADDPQ